MLLLLGLSLDKNKNLWTELQKISGFGKMLSALILLSFGFSRYFLVGQISSFQVRRLLKFFFTFKVLYTTNLAQKARVRFEALVKMKHRKALRVFYGLPIRGQRTKTNAKTVKIK